MEEIENREDRKMGVCTLVDELNRLRKSSSDSIDSEKSYGVFKQYMHVRRNVEDDLKSILREVRASGKKTLVLVCGSAGDGKSHMLSYLKNCDGEQLLDRFRIHNDATESSAPNKTAIETLSEVLSEFADETVGQPGSNMIMAINLGVLNNFIESEYGTRYSKLKDYVEKHEILSTRVIDDHGCEDESAFRHVSFSDYQMYTLSSGGVRSAYIEEILEKIYGNHSDTPFMKAFCNGCSNCALQKKCPVRYNFLFMQDQNVRKYIADVLVMTIIKEKEILTTREILNYLYDITVPQDFTYSGLSESLSNTAETMKNFIKGMTPALIFDQVEVTALMDHARKHDPLLSRTEESDDFAVEYYVSTDNRSVFEKGFGENPYGEFLLQPECIATANHDTDVKSKIFSSLIRINAIEKHRIHEPVYDAFIRDLYLYNAGKRKRLGALYDMVEKAVLQWCGTDGEGHMCLDAGNARYVLFGEVKFDADLTCIPVETDQEELQRFVPELRVGFENPGARAGSMMGSGTYLEIDYALYELMNRLNKGYVRTANDRNNHADFISFIEKILRTGSTDQEVFVVSKQGGRSVLQKTKFGYKFGVTR